MTYERYACNCEQCRGLTEYPVDIPCEEGEREPIAVFLDKLRILREQRLAGKRAKPSHELGSDFPF
jgi:hypothetical protein